MIKKYLSCFGVLLYCATSMVDVQAQCVPATAITTLDVNNVNAALLNGGDMWWDFTSARYEVPNGSGRTAFFSSAFWIGGLDNSGTLHLAGQRFRGSGNDYWPGPLDTAGTTTGNDCVNFDRHWKVNRTTINDFIAGNLANIPASIRDWPGKGNPNLAFAGNRDLAPFVDTDGDGVYIPDSGDYPAIKGDQAVWWVINDAGNLHTETGSNMMGLEIHIMAYAYASADILNNTTFYEYTVQNKSSRAYSDTYIGLFVDGDLGNAFDDYIASDSARNLGIFFNGDNDDEDAGGQLGYGTNPPIAGVRMLESVEQNGQELGMSSFMYFNNGGANQATTDPATATDYYNYMQGRWKDGTPLTFGGDGHLEGAPISYAYPSEPSDANGWSECTSGNTPGDRRFVMAFGPFDLDPGASQNFTYAAIWSRDMVTGGGCVDLGNFRSETDDVQEFFDTTSCKNFSPVVTATISNATFGANGGVVLDVTGLNGPVNYSWSNGSTAKDLSNVPGGTYTVVISNNNQCFAVFTYEVDMSVGIVDPTTDIARIYPNPAEDRVTIELGTLQAGVTLHDLTGREIAVPQTRQRGQTTLSLEAISAGVYLVRIQGPEQQRVMRLVKQ